MVSPHVLVISSSAFIALQLASRFLEFHGRIQNALEFSQNYVSTNVRKKSIVNVFTKEALLSSKEASNHSIKWNRKCINAAFKYCCKDEDQ